MNTKEVATSGLLRSGPSLAAFCRPWQSLIALKLYLVVWRVAHRSVNTSKLKECCYE